MGIIALEYAGLSTVSDITAVDHTAHASGTTTNAATVTSGPTAPTSASNELAVGFYADSGFSDTLAPGSGFTSRSNVSPTGDMELLAEDQTVAAGAQPNAGVQTGANTVWLMATVVFQTAQPSVPGAPTLVNATPGNGTATVTWAAAPSGNSPLLSYTVTPYIGTTAQATTSVTGTPLPTSTVVNGLTNGTSYTFTVTATNAIGSGPESAHSAAVTPGLTPGGQWSSLMSWPIVAVHSVLLDNGKTLAFDGWQQPEPTDVWDPTTQNFTTVNAPDSIFCSGTADLPDGRIMVIGGYGGLSTGQQGIVDTNIFDPTTSTWTRVANMHAPRWYPTLTELSDGRYLALSGQSTTSANWADTPEVYDPSTNTWTLLSNISTSQVHEEEYPFSYLVPNGDVFTIAQSVDKSFFLNVPNQTWTQIGGSSGISNGSSVMYRPGHVLYTGGAPSAVTNTPASANASVIDLTATNPTWQAVAPMNNARIYHTLTMLADGTVLAVGGEQESNNPNATLDVTSGVLPAEIWNPTTGTWTTVASMATGRNYHSTAVLQPDGTVLVAGGGHEEGVNGPGQYSAQIYSPPYLFQGPRPTITSAPSATTYGSTIPISTPDAASISSVNLVSLGADTHQIDMDQHFVPLNFTATSGGLSVQAPTSSSVAPPGNYMVFIVNGSGVPSVAAMINIAQTATLPAAPSGVTATPGNSSATVTWTAPGSSGSPLSSYTVTPYNGTTALPATVVKGSPPPTVATVTGLNNGTPYTFTVSATNGVGTGPPSSPSPAVTPTATPPPAYVQQASAHAPATSSIAVTPGSNLTTGNRLVVEVGAWSGSHATTASVSDSAGDAFTELLHFTASDGAEMSIWSAPITGGGGTRPIITAKPTAAADMGIGAVEYSGLSSVADSSVVDQSAHATGTTSGAATVSSGATGATTAPNELAIGFYADSGFSDTLAAGAPYTARINMSPTSDIEAMAEDQVVAQGTTPNAGVVTGAKTVWLAATLVLKSGVATPPGPPGAPPTLTATAGNTTATVNWTAPTNGGSPITSYTVTPYIGTTAQPATVVTGTPPVTNATVTGLTNGTAYTFTVTAKNGVGSGPPSNPSNAVTPGSTVPPAFVQAASAHKRAASIAVTPTSNLGSGNRLIVEVGAWSSSHAKTSSVSDSAGDAFTELLHFTASDGTEMSVWSAPISTGAGTKPTITAKASGTADLGVAALEYSGLSAVGDATVVDQSASATGTTTSATSVSSGNTAQTTASNELAIGFYADSGFGDTLAGDAGYTPRVNVSPTGDMELLVEDGLVSQGATPSANVSTGPNTTWLMALLVLKPGP
jgi:hypothetical protein